MRFSNLEKPVEVVGKHVFIDVLTLYQDNTTHSWFEPGELSDATKSKSESNYFSLGFSASEDRLDRSLGIHWLSMPSPLEHSDGAVISVPTEPEFNLREAWLLITRTSIPLSDFTAR